MTSKELIGYNTKWYRYQRKMTQEQFSEETNFKMAYISRIESGRVNLTCDSIDIISNALKIDSIKLLSEETAIKAKKLPSRVDQYVGIL